MPEPNRPLGRITAVYGLSSAHIQRAVFTTVLSFLFFLAMMVGYYVRQDLVYFLLASAFLVIYIITMFSLVVQRRTLLQIFENGVAYKKRFAMWSEISEVRPDGTVVLTDNTQIVISRATHDLDNALALIRNKIPGN